MKNLIYVIVFAALMAGCTLNDARSTETKKDSADAKAELHLGDPTFTHEVVRPEEPADKGKTEAPAGAVVSRERNVPSAPPVEEPTPPTDLERGLALHEQGKLRDARQALTAALFSDLDEAEEARALKTLREINERIFLSDGPDGDLTIYTVERGDTLARIARRHGATWELIQRINRLESTRINIGQELKLLNGSLELVVRKERFVMDLLLDGAFIQRYEVGLGVGGSTPLGEFTVKNRIPRPADGSYPYGHEKHRLGTRWLGLEGERGYEGYGIHGCRPDEVSQIPGECSQGCVRMTNADVEEIFDIVPVGTRVRIIER